MRCLFNIAAIIKLRLTESIIAEIITPSIAAFLVNIDNTINENSEKVDRDTIIKKDV